MSISNMTDEDFSTVMDIKQRYVAYKRKFEATVPKKETNLYMEMRADLLSMSGGTLMSLPVTDNKAFEQRKDGLKNDLDELISNLAIAIKFSIREG